jgi:hypothetical protein
MSVIQTRTGVLIDVLNPSPGDFNLVDIGSALAKTNRFGGHTVEPYSVAQHSVIMAKLVPEEDRLWALMHDATEAYIGDLPKPIKNTLPAWDEMEGRIMGVIAEKYGLTLPMPASVKEADVRLFLTEVRDLMRDTDAFGSGAEGLKPYDFPINVWSWREAEALWLHDTQEALR